MIAVEDLVPSSKVDAICEAVSAAGGIKKLSAIKDACPSDVSYQDIILVIASLEQS